MKCRPVLLDGSFIDALLDDGHPSHDAAVAVYATLLDNFQAGTDRLFALSTVLGGYSREIRRGKLAAIENTWVARQHRTAVRDVTAASPDVAMTLLMLRRERFGAVATALHDFDSFDIDVLSVAPDALAGPSDLEQIPDGEVDTFDALEFDDPVSSRTEPSPVPRSTDG